MAFLKVATAHTSGQGEQSSTHLPPEHRAASRKSRVQEPLTEGIKVSPFQPTPDLLLDKLGSPDLGINSPFNVPTQSCSVQKANVRLPATSRQQNFPRHTQHLSELFLHGRSCSPVGIKDELVVQVRTGLSTGLCSAPCLTSSQCLGVLSKSPLGKSCFSHLGKILAFLWLSAQDPNPQSRLTAACFAEVSPPSGLVVVNLRKV